MGKTLKISAIILEGGPVNEDLYKKTLASIGWVDEIIKVQTGKYKDSSFADYRNIGAKNAKGEWLLYIDTDEIVTDLLKKEIEEVVNDGKFVAYAIPRQNIFLGHEMHWGGWSPDYVIRLIKKDKLEKWEGELHEHPKIKGDVGNLKHKLIHNTHRSLSEMVDKTNKWSEIEAKLMYDAGHPPMNFFRFFSAGFREFWYRAIVKLGFLDGTVGVIEIIYQVFSRLISYSKLWELQLRDLKNHEGGNF